MAEQRTSKKNDAPQAEAPARKTRPRHAGAEEAKTPGEKTAKTGPSPLMAAALLVGMVIGSASAALVVASLLLRNTPAHAEPEPAKPAEKTAAGDKAGETLRVHHGQPADRQRLPDPGTPLPFRQAGVRPDRPTMLEKIKANQAELQHILIGILKGKTLDQLDDPDAVNVLGREIQETANTKLNLDQGITRVYFTQFVVQ